MYRAASAGLRVAERSPRGCGDLDLADGLTNVGDVDVVNLRCVLGPDSRRMLFRGSAAVLANSGHEPFGLVGLEAMAAGGLACVGGTGEDYAIPGWNALVLQTLDPGELVHTDCFAIVSRSERSAAAPRPPRDDTSGRK